MVFSRKLWGSLFFYSLQPHFDNDSISSGIPCNLPPLTLCLNHSPLCPLLISTHLKSTQEVLKVLLCYLPHKPITASLRTHFSWVPTKKGKENWSGIREEVY